jgi:hypothetical protein
MQDSERLTLSKRHRGRFPARSRRAWRSLREPAQQDDIELGKLRRALRES